VEDKYELIKEEDDRQNDQKQFIIKFNVNFGFKNFLFYLFFFFFRIMSKFLEDEKKVVNNQKKSFNDKMKKVNSLYDILVNGDLLNRVMSNVESLMKLIN
jgi:hypothetical protein